ncbi:MAG: ABC-2 family transporter protein [Opitutaceae bacterium]|jgi:ABC-2 type transport system permease protein|nr:ABC-2 family transporter protein [Opitutaceae bacterium]
MMFRFDFLMWTLVEFFWMAVNVLLVAVIYSHTDSIGGWNEAQMLLLVGTSMLVQRLMLGFFWSNLFELGRNIRDGRLDFHLAQPGNPVFMISTRKLDLDSLANALVAVAVIAHAAHRLGLEPTFPRVALYAASVGCALLIQYGLLLIIVSAGFWIIGTQGVEGGWFSLSEFSRLPREIFHGLAGVLLVWALPVVIVTNIPARLLMDGFNLTNVLWLMAATVFWLALGVGVFNAGLRRYASASS